MSTKTIRGVTLPRHDTAINWSKAVNFIPRKGEIVVYDTDNTDDIERGYYVDSSGNKVVGVYPSDKVRIKIGDGEVDSQGIVTGTKVSDLPFVSIGKQIDNGSIIIGEGNAIGEDSLVSGAGTQAGTKAFKILHMEYGNPEYIDGLIGDTINILSEDYNIIEGDIIECYLESIFERFTDDYTLRLSHTKWTGDTDYFEIDDISPTKLKNLGMVQGRYYYITFTNINPETHSATISKVVYRPNDDNKLYITVRGDVTSGETPYAVNDIIQLECKGSYHNSLKISQISVVDGNSFITAVFEEGVAVTINNLMLDTNDTDNTKNWLYVLGKNIGEVTPRFTNAIALGKNSIATGYASLALGKLNKAIGSSSVALGGNSIAGYYSLAAGADCIASGNMSVALGVGSQATARSAVAIGEYNKATVQGAFAGGINTEANGFSTIALGYGVKTKNVYGQMAVGRFNETSSALFVVGNGNSEKNLSNAFEVFEDGSAKITNALILTDKTTGKDYKVYISDGKIQMEVAE